MNFELTEDQNKRVDEWLHNEVYPEVTAEQKKNTTHPNKWHTFCWNEGYPYQGAIGGGHTYHFTPNSIGCTIKVTAYGKELDISDYENW